MVKHGIFHLRENCKLQPGVPLKPMLAKPTKSITEVLDRFEGKNFTCEYKYDGERAQIHYVAGDSPQQYVGSIPGSEKMANGLSAIFSRNSEDLSKKYPDILAKLNTWIKKETKSFVLDCETVAWDLVEKKVLPFQQLMTRKRKDVKAEDVKVKVCVFAFDMLFYNGEVDHQLPFRTCPMLTIERPLSKSLYVSEDCFCIRHFMKLKANFRSPNMAILTTSRRFKRSLMRASKHPAKDSWSRCLTPTRVVTNRASEVAIGSK